MYRLKPVSVVSMSEDDGVCVCRGRGVGGLRGGGFGESLKLGCAVLEEDAKNGLSKRKRENERQAEFL